MPDLPTPRDYLGQHTVHAVCDACDHIAELDLAALIAAGHGDTPLVKLPLRCAACGRKDRIAVIVSGRSYALGEKPPERKEQKYTAMPLTAVRQTRILWLRTNWRNP